MDYSNYKHYRNSIYYICIYTNWVLTGEVTLWTCLMHPHHFHILLVVCWDCHVPDSNTKRNKNPGRNTRNTYYCFNAMKNMYTDARVWAILMINSRICIRHCCNTNGPTLWCSRRNATWHVFTNNGYYLSITLVLKHAFLLYPRALSFTLCFVLLSRLWQTLNHWYGAEFLKICSETVNNFNIYISMDRNTAIRQIVDYPH